MKFRLTAEHVCGASVSHPCVHGINDDPVDQIDGLIVEADDADDAAVVGERILADYVADREPCRCARHLRPGSLAWWASVCVTATPAD